jgi:hypothetical protein
MRGSRLWKEYSATNIWSKSGHPYEDAFYAVQQKAWMDEKRFLDWTKRFWTPYYLRSYQLHPKMARTVHDHG